MTNSTTKKRKTSVTNPWHFDQSWEAYGHEWQFIPNPLLLYPL